MRILSRYPAVSYPKREIYTRRYNIFHLAPQFPTIIISPLELVLLKSHHPLIIKDNFRKYG